MKVKALINYKIFYLLALIPFSISLNFGLESPIKKQELNEINGKTSEDVKYHSSFKNERITIYLHGYDKEFVIGSIVLDKVNTSKIEELANNHKNLRIKIRKPENRSFGDKWKYNVYNKIDIVELEIGQMKFLDLASYNESHSKNNFWSSVIFGFFGFALVSIGILEKRYRRQNKIK